MADKQDKQEDGVGWTESLGHEATNPEQPSRVGDLIITTACVDCLGRGTLRNRKCARCDGEGKVQEEWTVSGDENRIKAQFEMHVLRGAKLSIAEAENEGDSDEADKQRSVLQADRAAGYYKWDGKYVMRALKSVHGFSHMLFLLLRRCHPEITEVQSLNIFKLSSNQSIASYNWVSGNWSGSVPAGAGTKEEKEPTPTTRASEKEEKPVRAPVTMDD
jgi:hypothetical protein